MYAEPWKNNMQDQPTDRELITAVAHFLQTEIASNVTDHRLKFRALVAANVLTIVERELEMGETLLRAERARLLKLLDVTASDDVYADVEHMTRELARRIRAGQADDGPFHDAVFAHVKQTVIEKLQVANPKYLERVRQETR